MNPTNHCDRCGRLVDVASDLCSLGCDGPERRRAARTAAEDLRVLREACAATASAELSRLTTALEAAEGRASEQDRVMRAIVTSAHAAARASAETVRRLTEDNGHLRARATGAEASEAALREAATAFLGALSAEERAATAVPLSELLAAPSSGVERMRAALVAAEAARVYVQAQLNLAAGKSEPEERVAALRRAVDGAENALLEADANFALASAHAMVARSAPPNAPSATPSATNESERLAALTAAVHTARREISARRTHIERTPHVDVFTVGYAFHAIDAVLKAAVEPCACTASGWTVCIGACRADGAEGR